ncbi:MAG: tetratricopeptide repeat protein [Treponema sp.]|jgi:tetratricopeptide (TPR) repeat protein|nr:tetratricopeptide repeat protein [Treponema sp.]
MKKIYRLLSLAPLAVWFFAGCTGADRYDIDPYYLTGTKEKQEQLKNLWMLLKQHDSVAAYPAKTSPEDSAEERFSLAREIAAIYMRQSEYAVLNNFLSDQIDAMPDNRYNAYYLLMSAYAYMLQEAPQVAALYFEVILKNYPDLLVQGQSIHLACLNQLLDLVTDAGRRVKYYKELTTRFPDQTDLPVAYFMLGQAYEHIGEWDHAIEAYTQFLTFIGANVPGFPNAEHYAKQLVDFSKSSQDWTFETLSDVVNAVKAAIAAGNSRRLWGYRAKVNFFARSWSEMDADDSGMAEFNLSDFMQGTSVQYAAALDPTSNATEAYLKTWGWSQYISTWYLYFRKIYFPLNPDIHGRWEWAGVYYGEKF